MAKRLIICLSFFLLSCDLPQQDNAPRPELLIYCGTTMAHPIKEIAAIVERQKQVRITISQGGEEDLYSSLELSRKGDLYLPGAASYLERHRDEGLLGESVDVGYNQAALIVKKGNPMQVSEHLGQLLREDLAVVIGNEQTGSIGRETKRLLDSVGIYQQVVEHAVFLTTGSRNLNRALREGEADLILNWRATAFFEENRQHMQIIDLSNKLATPRKLQLNLLTFSKYPELARYFMAFAASEKGQAIFRRYGFIDNKLQIETHVGP